MILFEGSPGKVVALDGPGTVGTISLVNIPGSPIDFETQRSIITRISVSQEVNAQFLHTMAKHVYVYVFGDRIGGVGISGLSFAADCEDATPLHGVELMMQWYRKYKVSATQAPLRISLGIEENIDGFLTKMTTDIVDPQSLMVQWNCTLMSLPEED